jgi:RNA polymerase sigma factor (sigma-70 family)
MFKADRLAEESEDRLIRGCIEWDRNAQNTLYEKYCAKMFAVCFRFSKSREEAEDTFHEGFMKVFENIQSFKNTGSLEGWIRKIMVNTAIERFRKNSHLFIVQNIDTNNGDLDHYYSDDILSNIGAKELMHMIQKLPPVYKMVFNLYVFEGLKHKEIAERLGISEGTSKSNLSDARAILKKAINKNSNQLEQTISYNEKR